MSDALYTTTGLAAALAPEAHVAQLLAFEAALARAQARAGVIPPDAADAIADACRAELYDVDALYGEAARAGTLAIPLVKVLTTQVGAGHRAAGPERGRRGERGGRFRQGGLVGDAAEAQPGGRRPPARSSRSTAASTRPFSGSTRSSTLLVAPMPPPERNTLYATRSALPGP